MALPGTILGFLGGGWGQLLASIWGVLEQTKVDEEFKEFNENRQEEIETLINSAADQIETLAAEGKTEDIALIMQNAGQFSNDLGNLMEKIVGSQAKTRQRVLSSIDAFTASQIEGLTGRNFGLMQAFGQAREEVGRGFESLASTALAELEGAGGTEREVISRRFRQLRGDVQNTLIERGISGTTILPSALADVAREEQFAVTDLEDRLRQQRVNIMLGVGIPALSAQAQLSGQGLGALERASALPFEAAQRGFGAAVEADVGLSRDIFNTLGQFGQLGLAQGQDTFTNVLNAIRNARNLQVSSIETRLGIPSFLERIETTPPDRSAFNNLLLTQGGGLAPRPSGPNFFEQFGGALFGAAINPLSLLGAVPGLGAAGFGLGGLAGGGLSGLSGLGMFPSDRNLKEGIESVESDDVLDGLRRLAISRWSYIGDSTQHIGPMAQDVQEIFGVGDGKTLEVVDLFGIILASLKGIEKRLPVPTVKAI